MRARRAQLGASDSTQAGMAYVGSSCYDYECVACVVCKHGVLYDRCSLTTPKVAGLCSPPTREANVESLNSLVVPEHIPTPEPRAVPLQGQDITPISKWGGARSPSKSRRYDLE